MGTSRAEAEAWLAKTDCPPGSRPRAGILFAIDGAKEVRKAIRAVFDDRASVQRCVRHKERNVLEHLAERDRPAVKRRLRRAWAQTDYERALSDLRLLAGELERSHPGAASSLRGGMAETLTLTRMELRWSAAGMLEAERQFRRIIGYADLAKLAVAVEREVTAAIAPTPINQEAATFATA